MVESMNEVADRPDESAAVLEQELEREGFRWAARRIRDEFTESTWAAFWQTMVEGRSCAQVADEFGKSVGAVYTARSRVMQRLRQELESFNWTRILKQESDLDIERGRSSL